MRQIIGKECAYRKLECFAWACLVYHATRAFCRRTCDWRSDPLGKTRGQMEGAARSARQNIVEGAARAGTSRETELLLYDVARGSLEELAGDYEAYLTDFDEMPWRDDDPQRLRFCSIALDAYKGSCGDNARNEYCAYVQEMRKRFGIWLESSRPLVAANSILQAIDRARELLRQHMESVAETFRDEGGFTERLSAARLEARDAQCREQGAPRCPNCGKPMRKVVTRKGRGIGNPFWGCTDYPACTGTRTCTEEADAGHSPPAR